VNSTSVCPGLPGLFYAKRKRFLPLKSQYEDKSALINRFDYFLIGTFFIIGIYYAAYFDDTHP